MSFKSPKQGLITITDQSVADSLSTQTSTSNTVLSCYHSDLTNSTNTHLVTMLKNIINFSLNFPITILSATIMLIALTDTFLLPKMTTRFCYNSPEPTRVSSQCVLCNYFLFDATVMGCTGSTALNVNITATQAFCLISQCLGQIRQTPMFLGRKRRSLDDDQLSIDEVNQENENNLMIDDLTKSKSDEIPEIIEYNTDGVKQQFAIKKDVEATVIDLIGLDED